jgi:hypothetical protein
VAERRHRFARQGLANAIKFERVQSGWLHGWFPDG